MKIFATGMNYIQHTAELEGEAYRPDEPVIFTKAESALLKGGKPFFIPDWMGRIDYEAEVVIRISRLGRNIPVQFARRYYDAVTLGIDFTARDLQSRLRERALSWDLCKGFDGSAAIGNWIGLDEAGCLDGSSAGDGSSDIDGGALRLSDLPFRLDINGRTVQSGRTSEMIFGFDEIVSFISRYFTVGTGDIIYTGTPAGIGPVRENDRLEGWIGGRRVLAMRCK